MQTTVRIFKIAWYTLLDCRWESDQNERERNRFASGDLPMS